MNMTNDLIRRRAVIEALLNRSDGEEALLLAAKAMSENGNLTQKQANKECEE